MGARQVVDLTEAAHARAIHTLPEAAPEFALAALAEDPVRVERTAAIFAGDAHAKLVRWLGWCSPAAAQAGAAVCWERQRFAACYGTGSSPVCCQDLLSAYGQLLAAALDSVAVRFGTDRRAAVRAQVDAGQARLAREVQARRTSPSCACGHH